MTAERSLYGHLMESTELEVVYKKKRHAFTHYETILQAFQFSSGLGLFPQVNSIDLVGKTGMSGVVDVCLGSTHSNGLRAGILDTARSPSLAYFFLTAAKKLSAPSLGQW